VFDRLRLPNTSVFFALNPLNNHKLQELHSRVAKQTWRKAEWKKLAADAARGDH
jgi:hypothetical protein